MIKGKKDEIEFELPEDAEESFWLGVKEKAEKHAKEVIPEQVKALEDELKLNLAIVEIAEQKLKQYENKEI